MFLIAHLWAILAALLGLAGGGGILFAIFGLGLPVPQIVADLLGIVKNVFAFFRTPVGQVLGILALCALFLVIGIVKTARSYETKIAAINVAHQREISGLNAAWQAKVDKASADFRKYRTERDQKVDADVTAKVAAATADLSAKSQKLEAEVRAYAKLPHKNCVLGPADLTDGLRPSLR